MDGSLIRGGWSWYVIVTFGDSDVRLMDDCDVSMQDQTDRLRNGFLPLGKLLHGYSRGKAEWT